MPPPDALFDFPPITGFGGVRAAIHVRRVPNPNLMAIRQRTTVEIDDREYRPRPDLYTVAVEGIAGSGCDILAVQHAKGHSPLRWLVGAYIDTRVERGTVAIVAARATKIGVFVIFISQNLPFPRRCLSTAIPHSSQVCADSSSLAQTLEIEDAPAVYTVARIPLRLAAFRNHYCTVQLEVDDAPPSCRRVGSCRSCCRVRGSSGRRERPEVWVHARARAGRRAGRI